ncbi:peptidase C39 [Paenibacillus mesophilus]|uniref:C39 family peptidase n=1 Tax=Paenibacillus mesophilus TaxID=2582849 RepID=UPI00110D7D4B|nr:C39 family peptidase [Paenibacillus mesophilus]TMV48905.1 peptidase C39 [Paenibacillus mesophilus]
MKKVIIALTVAGGLTAVAAGAAFMPRSSAHTSSDNTVELPVTAALAGGGSPETAPPAPEIAISVSDAAKPPPSDEGSVSVAPLPLPPEAMIEVPVIEQLPELFNGCEVTSLAMLLEAAGHPVDKMELADRVAKDTTPVVWSEDGGVESWGNPDIGFVGDMTGETDGFGVYHGPVFQLLAEILPGRAEDLTEEPFDKLLAAVADGRPVVIWTNINFAPETVMETWLSDAGPVLMSWNEHAVLLVGYDADYFYVNDPFDGTAAKAIERDTLISSWLQMGSQAVTYKS